VRRLLALEASKPVATKLCARCDLALNCRAIANTATPHGVVHALELERVGS